MFVINNEQATRRRISIANEFTFQEYKVLTVRGSTDSAMTTEEYRNPTLGSSGSFTFIALKTFFRCHHCQENSIMM